MSHEYIIRKNIPLPPESRSRYPFAPMVKGDCFDAPASERAAVTAAMRRFMAEYPTHKFVVRKLDNTTIGCWRVE